MSLFFAPLENPNNTRANVKQPSRNRVSRQGSSWTWTEKVVFSFIIVQCLHNESGYLYVCCCVVSSSRLTKSLAWLSVFVGQCSFCS
uniref:Uncharacterized protein n=1 Tax=Arion vulgaris TaxID=1028688 RepID=A0A0B7AUR9_9EUPU